MSRTGGRRCAAAGALSALLACSFFETAMGQGADGGVSVTISRFDHSGNDYTLVVQPTKTDPPDPYMGSCERFEVHGTFGLLRGAKRNDDALTRPGHRKALEFLQQAFLSGQRFKLGSVGKGFVPVDPGKPCVVESRALRVVADDNGTLVLSYHDAP